MIFYCQWPQGYRMPKSIANLGSSYNVLDGNVQVMHTVQIVTINDIHNATVGEYNNNQPFNAYINRTKECLADFIQSPNDIFWYTCSVEEYQSNFDLSTVVETCIDHGYTFVVVETI